MLAALRRRLRDMDTLRQVLLTAEARARAEGATQPGAEHLVMAALALPDGTATRAFRRVGGDPGGFPAAVERQYSNALARIGMDPGGLGMAPTALSERDPPGPFRSKPSAAALVRRMAKGRPFGTSRPLLGADVLLAALADEVGVVARALAAMGVAPERLAEACRVEIAGAGNDR